MDLFVLQARSNFVQSALKSVDISYESMLTICDDAFPFHSTTTVESVFISLLMCSFIQAANT